MHFTFSYLFRSVIYQLWMKSPLIKTCKISFSLTVDPSRRRSRCLSIKCITAPKKKCENESAERWKIAYQIEAIRLNCSHKYCFSHAYIPAMIASACSRNSPPPMQYVLNRDVIFAPLAFVARMHVYDVPFQQRKAQDRKKKHSYVRHAIKKCFPEIATSAFCTRTPEITAEKIKSHHEVKIFAVARTQKKSRWHSCWHHKRHKCPWGREKCMRNKSE